MPVRYPASWSQVATVDESLKRVKPFTPSTPVCREYWPVKMLARAGQQSDWDTCPRMNVTPFATRSCWTSGMHESAPADRSYASNPPTQRPIVSHRWSSEMMTTTFGFEAACAGFDAPEVGARARAATRKTIALRPIRVLRDRFITGLLSFGRPTGQ